MRAVGLKILKNRLSEYVRMASGGETALVTDRDRAVAELVPPRPDRGWNVHDGLLAEAVREGWIVPPELSQSGPPPRLPVCSWSEIHRELAADREGR